MASIGQSITAPCFVEMDEVLRVPFTSCVSSSDMLPSGLIGKKHTLTFSSCSFVASSKPSLLFPGNVVCRPTSTGVY